MKEQLSLPSVLRVKVELSLVLHNINISCKYSFFIGCKSFIMEI